MTCSTFALVEALRLASSGSRCTHSVRKASQSRPGAFLASGCGTDHLAPEAARSVDDVIRAYEDQMAAIEALGGRLIVMASRALARVATGPADYERVYDRVLSQAREPVILHWLGDMFDPALKGYWGSADTRAAMDTALGIIAASLAAACLRLEREEI